jgi:hypothetical protein
MVYAAVMLLIGIQYERGWFAGLRHFSKELGREVPKARITGSRYAGFVIGDAPRHPTSGSP